MNASTHIIFILTACEQCERQDSVLITCKIIHKSDEKCVNVFNVYLKLHVIIYVKNDWLCNEKIARQKRKTKVTFKLPRFSLS